jgi:7-carboxy-7-deazaguanine synthase
MMSEVFGPTIQGEGALIGVPTVFVRTGGCDYRCSWCDTLYAVLPEYKADWQPMTAQEVFADIQRLSEQQPLLVTLSGGNPAIQPLEELLDLGHAHGYTFAIETQGSVAQRWFAKLDYMTLSPKPPSSKQVTRWDRLDRCIAYAQAAPVSQATLADDGAQTVSTVSTGQTAHQVHICLKVVVFDEADFVYAQQVAERYPAIPMYLQAGNHTPPTPTHLSHDLDMQGILHRMDWLIQRVIAEKWYSATILPQLHVLLWGNKRGV